MTKLELKIFEESLGDLRKRIYNIENFIDDFKDLVRFNNQFKEDVKFNDEQLKILMALRDKYIYSEKKHDEIDINEIKNSIKNMELILSSEKGH